MIQTAVVTVHRMRRRCRRACLAGVLAGSAVLAGAPTEASSIDVLSVAARTGNFGARVSLEDCQHAEDVVVPAGTVTSDHAACDTLTAADVQVPAAADVTFRAGNLITLSDGFSVASGARFVAAVDAAVGGDIFLTDERPASEVRYIASFSLDLTDLTLPASDQFDHFVGYRSTGQQELRVLLKKNASLQENRIAVAVREDGGTYATTEDGNELVVANGWRTIFLEWVASTGADDGSIELCVDASCASITGLDNDTGRIDRVRWGAQGVDPSTGGSLDVDDLESYRF